jgi:short-subunit dehydrogenase
LVVTGASSGIGWSLAEQAVKAGARAALAARSADRLEELARSLAGGPGEVLVVPTDVTVPADRERLLGTVVEEWGGLDVLINNAGVASFGHFSTSTEEVLRQVMEVNFFAPAELIRQAIPHLQRGQRPAIVNVASMCGRRGVPAWPEYSASKFGLCGLSDALRGEMARFDIDVLLVVPGLTSTGLSQHLLRNAGRMKINHRGGMPAEQVAAGILRALIRGKAETVLGWEARWILRTNRWFPWLVNYVLSRKVRKLYSATSANDQ